MIRIAPETDANRTTVRTPGAGVRNSAVFRARSVRTVVRFRRRCLADTFGSTFSCEKVERMSPYSIFSSFLPEQKGHKRINKK